MLVKTVLNWFHPTIDAFLATEVPFHYRWRLLLFQPVAILAYLINTVPTLFSKRATELEIPVRNGRKIRSLLYLPPQCCRALGPDYEDLRSTQQAIAQPLLRPLHLDIHGGGFLGGRPEANHRFCSALSARTGAVVVSTTYRFAPRYPFPAAIDDIDDVVAWLLEHAASKLQADPECFTLSGSSAGGNLALATSLSDMPRENRCKAVVTFYAPVCSLPAGCSSPPPYLVLMISTGRCLDTPDTKTKTCKIPDQRSAIIPPAAFRCLWSVDTTKARQ